MSGAPTTGWAWEQGADGNSPRASPDPLAGGRLARGTWCESMLETLHLVDIHAEIHGVDGVLRTRRPWGELRGYVEGRSTHKDRLFCGQQGARNARLRNGGRCAGIRGGPEQLGPQAACNRDPLVNLCMCVC